jgi:hypothetical protein
MNVGNRRAALDRANCMTISEVNPLKTEALNNVQEAQLKELLSLPIYRTAKKSDAYLNLIL